MAVCCNEHGVPTFDKLRHRSNDQEVILIAFDLLELDGNDLRREPFETRKATLASLLRLPGVQFNQHLTHRGDVVFAHACKMGLEGIVSKRLGSRYRSGRTSDWLKFKNPGGAVLLVGWSMSARQPGDRRGSGRAWADARRA